MLVSLLYAAEMKLKAKWENDAQVSSVVPQPALNMVTLI